jgi:hypothetical protein
MIQTSIPPAGFEQVISASEWLQAHALDRSTNGIATHRYFDKHTNSPGIKYRFRILDKKLLYRKGDSRCTVKSTELYRG